MNLGHAVTHLFDALRYKPEGRGLDSRISDTSANEYNSFRNHIR
jgi:hypothetical protein